MTFAASVYMDKSNLGNLALTVHNKIHTVTFSGFDIPVCILILMQVLFPAHATWGWDMHWDELLDCKISNIIKN